MIDENDDFFRENPWMKYSSREESEAVREAEYLRDLAHAMRMFADGLDAPFIMPFTKETMELAMRTAAVKLEQAADALKANGTRAEQTCRDLGGTDEHGGQVFNCSECGCVLRLYDRDGVNTLITRYIYDYPRYCPACGAKAVD